MSGVACLIETDGDGVLDSSLRALTLARSLARSSPLVAVTAAPPEEAVTDQLASYGITSLAHLPAGAVSGWAPQVLARAFSELLDTDGIDAAVAAATDHGNEVLAHLGALSGLDFVASCTEVARRQDGGFDLVRQRWGGSLYEEATLAAPAGAFSVATDAVPAVAAPAAHPPQVREVAPGLSESDLSLQAIESREEAAGVSLASAKVVVSGGRGIGGPEGFAHVEELASLLGGAVGVSRAVTSLGWRPHREQVGQTGTRVTPDLYLACGISGAIQHLAGCQSAKHMVAINTDPDAPIMARADYAIIGDAGEVLPALVEALRARREGTAG